MKALSSYTAKPYAMERAAYDALMRGIVSMDSEVILSKIDGTSEARIASASAISQSGPVAVIDVKGPIFQERTYVNQIMATLFGGCITEIMSMQFAQAMADPEIGSVLLRVNSPGGQAFGLDSFSEQIYNARGKGKPIVAFIDGMNASAAYYISSAADAIISTKDSSHGSIGSVLTIGNDAEFWASMGIKETVIVSDISPNKWPDEQTDEGRSLYQDWVNALGHNFADAVARNRGVSKQTVIQEYGQGWLKVGKSALAAGMIDGFASYEKTIAALSSGKWKSPRPKNNGGNKMSFIEEALVKAGWKQPAAEVSPAPGEETVEQMEAEHKAMVNKVNLETYGAPLQAGASLPSTPLTIAGMTEAEVLAMQAKLEENNVAIAQAQETRAQAFAASIASEYLENGAATGGGDDESEPIVSDRAKVIEAASALHLKAQRGEAISVDELTAFASVPRASAVVTTAVLAEEQIEGATAHKTETVDKKDNAGKGVAAVRASQQSMIDNLKSGQFAANGGV